MGKPTSATVVYDDGRLQPFGDVDAALTRVDRGRVEFQYAYGPDMLPSPPRERVTMWRPEVHADLGEVTRGVRDG